MFHGAHHKDIHTICQEGLYRDSYLTSSLNTAVNRAHYHERHNRYREYGAYIHNVKEVEVLAMVVSLPRCQEFMLNRRDEPFSDSNNFLPLFNVILMIFFITNSFDKKV